MTSSATERADLKFDHNTHFRFGRNWMRFGRSVGEPEIARSIVDLRRLLGVERLDGLRLLDIGCGSGLHSLAALRLGAEVDSIDIDPDSVAATRALLQRHWNGGKSTVGVRNVFLTEGETPAWDVVYSWGVLHHTGDMWEAVRRAAALVKPGGVLAIALYMKTPYCDYWRGVKKRFTEGSPMVKSLMISKFAGRYVWKKVKKGRNPFAAMKRYGDESARGMHWYTDLVDWLGGYPYESATSAEVVDFVCGQGFEREAIFNDGIAGTGRSGSGNIEYRFRRAAAPAASGVPA